jgi:hypothetical protein
VRLTFGIVFASVTLGVGEVRSAVVCDEVAILGEETVEEGPSTVATFVHVVASHELLW